MKKINYYNWQSWLDMMNKKDNIFIYKTILSTPEEAKLLVALAFAVTKWHPKSNRWSAKTCSLCFLNTILTLNCDSCILTKETGLENRITLGMSKICSEICKVFKSSCDEEGSIDLNNIKIKKVQRKIYNLLFKLYRIEYNNYFGTNY